MRFISIQEAARGQILFDNITMAFTLWNLIKAAILCTNACAILHETRFLKHFDVDAAISAPGVEASGSASHSAMSLKQQAANFLFSVRFLRLPLIALNSVAIIIELVFG